VSVGLTLQSFGSGHAFTARTFRVRSMLFAFIIYFVVKAEVEVAMLTLSFGLMCTLFEFITDVAIKRDMLSQSTAL